MNDVRQIALEAAVRTHAAQDHSTFESTHRMATDVLEIADHFVSWLKNKGEEGRTAAYSHRPKSATEWVGLCGGGGIMAAMTPGGVVPVSAVSCPECLALMSPARERGTYVENTTSREQEGQ